VLLLLAFVGCRGVVNQFYTYIIMDVLHFTACLLYEVLDSGAEIELY